jgi:hypothetical protein
MRDEDLASVTPEVRRGQRFDEAESGGGLMALAEPVWLASPAFAA